MSRPYFFWCSTVGCILYIFILYYFVWLLFYPVSVVYAHTHPFKSLHARPFRGYILEMQSKHASLHVSRIGTLTYFVHQSERKKMNLCTKVLLFTPICRWFWDSSQQRMANLAIWRRGQRKLKPFCFLLGSMWNRWWRQKCGTILKNLCVWQFGHRVIRSSSTVYIYI